MKSVYLCKVDSWILKISPLLRGDIVKLLYINKLSPIQVNIWIGGKHGRFTYY